VSPATAVVILSAYGYFSYAQKALKSGATDYLLKPFTSAALLEAVDGVGAARETRGSVENPDNAGSPGPRDELGEQAEGIQSLNKANKCDLLISRCISFIGENYQEAWLSPTEIASHFHFNTAYYSSLFKKRTGLSLAQYLLNFRLNKAKELLFSTELKVYEIAQAVGFNDDKYFIRVFVKETGITPNAFRTAGDGGVVCATRN
jgi:two-component system response regulator YesN